jgi:NAD-dependent dihydropyrimidine dehydrogenase PreA subunit
MLDSMEMEPGRSLLLFCRCDGTDLPSAAVARAVRAALAERGMAWLETGDLCGALAHREAWLIERLRAAPRVVALACRPRAVRWLLHAAGCPLPPERLQVLDLRRLSAEEILAQLPAAGGAADRAGESVPEPAHGSTGAPWRPWYPVIDYDRCRQCRQCVNFCLFGVYDTSPDGRVTVAQPRQCKNNCPACARICPDAAIIFPKLPGAEAPLDGEEVGDAAAWQARMKVNTRDILGEDVHAALIERQREARKRRLRRAALEQAEEERRHCRQHGS